MSFLHCGTKNHWLRLAHSNKQFRNCHSIYTLYSICFYNQYFYLLRGQVNMPAKANLGRNPSHMREGGFGDFKLL